MKSQLFSYPRHLSIRLLFIAVACTAVWIPNRSIAQHGHLNVGATGVQPGDPLIFANAEAFITESGFVLSMPLADEGRFAGYYNANITLTALPATAELGGPDPQAPAVGAYIQYRIVQATGPMGGAFGFWDVGTVEPSFTLLPGETSEDWIVLSQSDGSPGSDPYGHIHGRRFSTGRPGVFTAWFQAFDTGTNGPAGGPIHTPTDPVPVRFLAGTPDLLEDLPLSGTAVPVFIEYAEHGDDPHFHVHVGHNTPLLTPLAISHPGFQVHPSMPWFDALDPSMAGRAWNRQYTLRFDPASEPLPAGHLVGLRLLEASPGLQIFLADGEPSSWEPLFPSDPTAWWVWDQQDIQPVITLPPGSSGPVQARFEVALLEPDATPTPYRDRFALNWNVTRGLFADQTVHDETGTRVQFLIPEGWTGYSYRLERTRDFRSWTVVSEVSSAEPGPVELLDPNPPADYALYRIRPLLP